MNILKTILSIFALTLISVPAQSDTPKYWKFVDGLKKEKIKFYVERGSYEQVSELIWQFRIKIVTKELLEKIATRQCQSIEKGIITRDTNIVWYFPDGRTLRDKDEDWLFFDQDTNAFGLCSIGKLLKYSK